MTFTLNLTFGICALSSICRCVLFFLHIDQNTHLPILYETYSYRFIPFQPNLCKIRTRHSLIVVWIIHSITCQPCNTLIEFDEIISKYAASQFSFNNYLSNQFLWIVFSEKCVSYKNCQSGPYEKSYLRNYVVDQHYQKITINFFSS